MERLTEVLAVVSTVASIFVFTGIVIGAIVMVIMFKDEDGYYGK